MTSDTRYKLSETVYFLSQLKANEADINTFRFNLSAFISAARSVSDVMQQEYARHQGFSQWHGTTLSGLFRDPVVAYFNAKRNANVHAVPVAPQQTAAIQVHDRGQVDEAWHVEKRNADGSVDYSAGAVPPQTQPAPIPSSITFAWYFLPLSQHEVDSYLTFIRTRHKSNPKLQSLLHQATNVTIPA